MIKMKISRGGQLLFLSYLVIKLVSLTTAQPDLLYHDCTTNISTNTNNTMYQKNVNTLLSSLSSKPHTYGFYNSSVGEMSDTVNAIALCRPPVDLDTCRSCVSDSATKLVQACPNAKEAIGGYDNCMVRFSNKFIYGVMSSVPSFSMWSLNNVSKVDQFNQAVATLLDTLRSQAAAGGALEKFATGSKTGPEEKQTIYGLVQCTPDLSEQDCNECLFGAANGIPECCSGRIGGRVITPSCNIRYELYNFFKQTLANAPGKNGKTTQKTVIIIFVLAVTSVILVVSISILQRKEKQEKSRQKFQNMDEISTVESLRYDFSTINIATDNFSDANKLGQGGFGVVYKGNLPSGQVIAVKRLSNDSGQGDVEFKNEIMLLAKLQHRNLVRLLGFCLEGVEKILVYEFVNNSSLDNFIFDPINRAHLDWNRRYKIIEGIARGLLYLHEDSLHRIIHRDLKASNILLDEQMNPKISDFGMAKLFVVDETHESTRRIVGTYGYMAPEYLLQGYFSVKSDVFSFGVLILEIVSGKKNNYFGNGEDIGHIISHVWRCWQEGIASRMIDPTLMRDSSGSTRDIIRCIHIGLLCVQENMTARPTIASVVLMLNSLSMSLAMPSEPAFTLYGCTNEETQFPQENNSPTMNHMSRNQASIIELYPR